MFIFNKGESHISSTCQPFAEEEASGTSGTDSPCTKKKGSYISGYDILSTEKEGEIPSSAVTTTPRSKTGQAQLESVLS